MYDPAQQMIDPTTQMVDPNTGMPVETTMVPPAPSNTLGAAQPVFNDSVTQAAQGIYGTQEQRQMSVGNKAPLFKKKY